MVKINPGVSRPRGRISSQKTTTVRSGNFRQQRKRVTVKTRNIVKRKKIKRRSGFVW